MNKTKWLAFLWLVLLYIFQAGLGSLFGRLFPPLVLLTVIFYSLVFGPAFGIFFGVCAGLLLEIYSVGMVGFTVLNYGVMGYGAGLLSKKFFRDGFFTQILLGVGSEALNLFFSYVQIQLVLGDEAHWMDAFREAFYLPHLLATAIFSPILFWFLEKGSMLGNRRRTRWP